MDFPSLSSSSPTSVEAPLAAFSSMELEGYKWKRKNTSERVFQSVRRRTKKTIFLYWLTFCPIVSCCWYFGDEFAVLMLSFPIDDYPQVISAVVDWFASLELTRECVGVIKWMGTLHRCWHVTKAVSERREIFSVRFARNSQTDSTFIANEIRKTVFFYLFSWFVAENWITKKGSLYYFHYEYLQRNGAHPLILLSLW